MFLGETFGLYLAISRVCELGYNDIIFEHDGKYFVDAFNWQTTILPLSLGSLNFINVCKCLFSFFNCNSHVEFSRRNANMSSFPCGCSFVVR